MSKSEIIMLLIFIFVHIELFCEKHKQFFKRFKKTRKEEIIKSLAIKQKEDELVVEKDNYYYNLDDKDWYKLTDRDMIMLLETAYNDYTHENLDSLNSIFTAALRLRDDKR